MGIKLSCHLDLTIEYLYLLLITTATLTIVLQLVKTRRRSLINTAHLLLFVTNFVLIGYLRYHQVNTVNDFEGPIKSTFSATVLHPPVLKPKSYRVDLLIDSAITDSGTYAINTKIISYIQKDEKSELLLPGECIIFTSTLNPPSGLMNPNDFNYKSFLKRKLIFATSYIPSNSWQKQEKEVLSIKILAARVQYKVVKIIEDLGYDNEEMALLSALTVGYKQKIGENQRQAYVASGSTHVLAVSGLHVGIIFLFLTRLFKIFGKSRKVVITRLCIIIFLLWCFAFITGLSPSVTRATVMFSLVSIGTAGRQRSSIFNTVFLSALILLILNPQLLFDIGFQLSYCAVLGIIAFQPYFAKLFIAKLHLPKMLADLMAVSIAAQLGTAPLSIHTFNCFPNYFILTNIWVIPLVGIIVNIAIILILVALVGLPTTWIAIPLEWFLKIMNSGVEIISHLPHALSSFLYIDTVMMVLLYVSLIVLIFALDYHSKRYLFCMILTIITSLLIHIYQQEQRKDIEKFIIFSNRKVFNIAAQQGFRSNILFEKDSAMGMPSYFTHHFLAKQTLNVNHFQDAYKNYNFCLYSNFIITSNQIHAIYNSQLSSHSGTIEIETLIIHHEEPQSIYRLYEHLIFKTLVLYQRPQKHENYYRNFCEKNDVKLHLVYKEGAYITEF